MDQRPNTLLNGRQKPTVDWSKYGLHNDQQHDQSSTWRNLSGGGGDYASGGHQPADVSELFAGEQVIIIFLLILKQYIFLIFTFDSEIKKACSNVVILSWCDFIFCLPAPKKYQS